MPLFASHLAQIDQWTELQRQKEIPESTVARTYSFLFAFPSHPRFPLTSSSSNSQIFPSQRSQAFPWMESPLVHSPLLKSTPLRNDRPYPESPNRRSAFLSIVSALSPVQ